MHTGNLANDMLDLHPETPDISMRNERPKDQTMFLLVFFLIRRSNFVKTSSIELMYLKIKQHNNGNPKMYIQMLLIIQFSQT